MQGESNNKSNKLSKEITHAVSQIMTQAQARKRGYFVREGKISVDVFIIIKHKGQMSRYFAWAGKFLDYFESCITVPSIQIVYYTILPQSPVGIWRNLCLKDWEINHNGLLEANGYCIK